MSSSSDFFDLILVGTPQIWQMGGFGPVYLHVRGVSGFIGKAPDNASGDSTGTAFFGPLPGQIFRPERGLGLIDRDRMPLALAAGDWNDTPQNHVSAPAFVVDQIDAPDVASAVKDVVIFVLPEAAFDSGPWGAGIRDDRAGDSRAPETRNDRL